MIERTFGGLWCNSSVQDDECPGVCNVGLPREVMAWMSNQLPWVCDPDRMGSTLVLRAGRTRLGCRAMPGYIDAENFFINGDVLHPTRPWRRGSPAAQPPWPICVCPPTRSCRTVPVMIGCPVFSAPHLQLHVKSCCQGKVINQTIASLSYGCLVDGACRLELCIISHMLCTESCLHLYLAGLGDQVTGWRFVTESLSHRKKKKIRACVPTLCLL